MPEMREATDVDGQRQAENTRKVPSQVNTDDEYLIEYDHWATKKLRLIYDTHEDNRAAAIDSAQRTATSDGVTNLRVYRRPKSDWEPVDWRG